MRLKFSLLVSLLLLLSSPLSYAEKSYTLTQTEYDQIITNMMTAQKALAESDSQLEKADLALQRQEEELQTLKEDLQNLSAYYKRQQRKATGSKILIGGCAFTFGAAAGICLALYAAR